MEFTIKGKTHQLNFGVRFVAEIDKTQEFKERGIQFGVGLVYTEQLLELGNFEALATIIQHAIKEHKYSLGDIYDALDEYDDLEGVVEGIKSELKNSVAVQMTLTKMEQTAKEMQRKQAVKLTEK